MLEKIIKKLIESGYDKKTAQSLGERLATSRVIYESLLKWINDGVETDCRFEEISAFKLMRERRFTYPNALNTIAWLHKDAKAARKALASGIDRITKGEQ